ncbi:MAG: hypothetical protein K0Q68_2447 [Moraxellaceae bacterium]|jgi:hypothetical protein|nr:hypothetical protein [Moraxellaceae bacterium]
MARLLLIIAAAISAASAYAQPPAVPVLPGLVAPPMPRDDRAPVSENNLGRAKLQRCRTIHDWEPDEYVRKLPLCKDEPPTKDKPPKPEAGGADSRDDEIAEPEKVPGYEKYSCWVAPADCLVSTAAWGTSAMDRQSRRFYTYHKNICAGRLVVKACIERDGLKPFCGMSHVDPGKTWSWDVSRSNGRYRVLFAGIERGNDDFICPKPVGWRELGK